MTTLTIWKKCRLAAIIVIIVLIIYIYRDLARLIKNNWLADNDSPWDVYRRSNGAFDNAAAIALRRASRNPTPMDHFLSATVITNNILNQQTRAAVETPGWRRDLRTAARDHYMAALRGMREPARPRRTTNDADHVELRRHFTIIDAAANFARAGPHVGDPTIVINGMYDVDYPLAQMAERNRDETVKSRQRMAKEAADEQGGAKGAAVDTYVNLATQHTDDPQNTHDTAVLASLKGVVTRLQADQGPIETVASVATIINDLHTNGARYSENRPLHNSWAENIVDRAASHDERIMGLGGVSVGECLRRVWQRADDPRNAGVRDLMRQSLFDNLVDAFERDLMGNWVMVCANGRATRILSSLVLLDFDKRNWNTKKFEQVKNDVFAKAHEVIMAEAQHAANTTDDLDRQKAGLAYLANTVEEARLVGEVPEAAEEKLADDMRKAIGEMIDDYVRELKEVNGEDGVIPIHQIGPLKMEAQAAVA